MELIAVLADAVRAAVGPQAAVFALAAIGLNLQFGYTGLLNFGQAGFMLVGGYGLAVSVVTFDAPLWLGVLVGLAAAVVLGLLLGVPTLRLRGDYLAITTIAAAEILRIVFRSDPLQGLTNGVFGLQRYARGFYDLSPIPPGRYGVGRLSLSAQELWAAVTGWSLVAAGVVLVAVLARSPWGRVLRAIRDDEDAARSLGKNVYAYKMQALVLGGVAAGLAGMLLALAAQSVTPDSYPAETSFFVFAVLLLGGRGTVMGPVLGSLVFWLLLAATDSGLRRAISGGLIDETVLSGSQVGSVRFILVGVALIVLMAFRSEGILGRRRKAERRGGALAH